MRTVKCDNCGMKIEVPQGLSVNSLLALHDSMSPQCRIPANTPPFEGNMIRFGDWPKGVAYEHAN